MKKLEGVENIAAEFILGKASIHNTWLPSIYFRTKDGRCMWSNDLFDGVNVTSQCDDSNKSIYAIKFEIRKPTHQTGVTIQLMKRYENFIKSDKHPNPLTFGQFAFNLCRAFGIDEIWFRREDCEWDYNNTGANYLKYSLKDGAAKIDNIIRNTCPFVTELAFY